MKKHNYLILMLTVASLIFGACGESLDEASEDPDFFSDTLYKESGWTPDGNQESGFKSFARDNRNIKVATITFTSLDRSFVMFRDFNLAGRLILIKLRCDKNDPPVPVKFGLYETDGTGVEYETNMSCPMLYSFEPGVGKFVTDVDLNQFAGLPELFTSLLVGIDSALPGFVPSDNTNKKVAFRMVNNSRQQYSVSKIDAKINNSGTPVTLLRNFKLPSYLAQVLLISYCTPSYPNNWDYVVDAYDESGKRITETQGQVNCSATNLYKYGISLFF